MRAVVELYTHGDWRYDDSDRREGYSVVLWGLHGVRPQMPAAEAVAPVRRLEAVSSVQITFDPAKPPAEHAMPPGGFRLAIVNCWDLACGQAAREGLRSLLTVR